MMTIQDEIAALEARKGTKNPLERWERQRLVDLRLEVQRADANNPETQRRRAEALKADRKALRTLFSLAMAMEKEGHKDATRDLFNIMMGR
jgi:hypothetical protein